MSDLKPSDLIYEFNASSELSDLNRQITELQRERARWYAETAYEAVRLAADDQGCLYLPDSKGQRTKYRLMRGHATLEDDWFQSQITVFVRKYDKNGRFGLETKKRISLHTLDDLYLHKHSPDDTHLDELE